MVMKQRFGNRKFHAANEKAEGGIGFFLLSFGGKGKFWECSMFQKDWLWTNQMTPSK
jgi:hypothetical protein